MILCSCNVLSSASLREAAEALRSADPSRPVTAGRLFLALGARPQCGSCIELVRKSLREWGFPLTCPEPLASIADQQPGNADEDEETIEWGMV
jgi:bacterioferritin-associated ferredoxin